MQTSEQIQKRLAELGLQIARRQWDLAQSVKMRNAQGIQYYTREIAEMRLRVRELEWVLNG